MFKKQIFISMVAVLLVIFMGLSSPSAAQETLKIGSIWGLSGPYSQLGVVCRDGALLAAEWINAKGGITVKGKKYKIELVVEDNKNTAPGSVNAATKLVHGEKVKFITGMNIPFQIDAVQTITEPAKVILSSGKAANLLPKNRYSFSATQVFTAPIPNIYDFLSKKYPKVKIIAFEANDEAGAIITSKVAKGIAQMHKYQVQETTLNVFGAKDFYPTWTKILKNKPDAVDLCISTPDDLASKAKQGRELGFKGPILTCNSGDPFVFIHLIGKEGATDFIFAGFEPTAANTPAMVKTILKLWNEKYKKPFSLDAIDGFSSVWALVQAIEKAQSFETDTVVKVWETMKTIETPTGKGKMSGLKTFGINHMVAGPAPVSLLKNGKVESTSWYKPADM
ncbi:MAG: ABC transporter substrate-binding protein [Deltaproteobacteria bacterium]|nr:ABC transporter substrate-binding protein [Deltaproteobacteria bacterium]